MTPFKYFQGPDTTTQKKYEALRAFFYEKQNATEVAHSVGYDLRPLYSLPRDFRTALKRADREEMFFNVFKAGRKGKEKDFKDINVDINTIIIENAY